MHTRSFFQINTLSDEFSQLATDYSAAEMNLLKQMIDAIANAHKFQLSSIKALQLGRPKVGAKDMEALLSRFIISNYVKMSA